VNHERAGASWRKLRVGKSGLEAEEGGKRDVLIERGRGSSQQQTPPRMAQKKKKKQNQSTVTCCPIGKSPYLLHGETGQMRWAEALAVEGFRARVKETTAEEGKKKRKTGRAPRSPLSREQQTPGPEGDPGLAKFGGGEAMV